MLPIAVLDSFFHLIVMLIFLFSVVDRGNIHFCDVRAFDPLYVYLCGWAHETPVAIGLSCSAREPISLFHCNMPVNHMRLPRLI